MLLAAFRTWLQIISERLLKTSTPPFHHHVGVTRETKQSARSPADLRGQGGSEGDTPGDADLSVLRARG